MRNLIRAAALLLLPGVACAQVTAPAAPQASTPAATVAIPPNTKVEGLPPIPQSIADDLARYADYTSARLVSWNPSKRQLLIFTRLAQAPQLYSVDAPARAPVPITSDKQGVPPSIWAQFDPADANTLVIRRDAEAGTERYNLYKYDVAAGTLTLLTDGKSQYARPPVGDPVWAPKGKWIAYDSTERNGRDRDLWIMQPSDPKTAKMLIDAGGIWIAQGFSPEATALLTAEVIQSGVDSRLWRVDVKSGERKLLTPADEHSYWGDARFSPDGKTIYAISTRGSGVSRIWRTQPSGGTWLPVTPENQAVSGYAISAEGLIAVVFDRGSTDELQVLDPGTQKPRRLPAIAAGLISNVAWRPGSRELGFTLQNARSPGDVFSIDTALATPPTRWTTSRVGAFDPSVLPQPEIVTWKGFDGLPITGVLYRPASKFTGPRPIVINFHGGPLLRWRPVFHGRGNYLTNELGVAVLFPNYRGSDGFGMDFGAADDGKKREGVLKDVGSLLDWIALRPEFDKSRVMLTGASYGGWLALESAVRYNDRIRGVFELSGMTDLVTFLEETDASRRDDRRKEYGDERDPDMRAFLLSISPITRARDLREPVGIVHPGNDTRVPVSQAQELVEAVKKNNMPVWYVQYDGVGHDNFPGTRQNDNFDWAVWIQFVKMYLLN